MIDHIIKLDRVQRHLHYRAADLRRKSLIKRAYGVIYRGTEEDTADLVIESITCGVRLGVYFEYHKPTQSEASHV